MLFDLDSRMQRIQSLENEVAKPEAWGNPERAQELLKEISRLKKPVSEFSDLNNKINELELLIELARAESDSSLLPEIQQELKSLSKSVKEFELSLLLSGEYCGYNAILSFHPGAGGTESQDWAEMLLRMYTRWADKHGYRVQVLDYLVGEEAGIKSATILINGENAYGFLRGEKGVHRLVRISPFDASGRRHTSFASVDVIPEIRYDDEVQVSPDELKIETFRSSGAGGQHVNKTESAVRITHLPTGIVVSCQNERSQHSNKQTAMKILKSRLLELKAREREKELQLLRGEQQEIAWGNQIRSYVLQPYSLVKDHRTNVEVGNVQGVLEGDIDEFIYAYLKQTSTLTK